MLIRRTMLTVDSPAAEKPAASDIDRPDLPELESVSAQSSTLIALAWFGWFLATLLSSAALTACYAFASLYIKGHWPAWIELAYATAACLPVTGMLFFRSRFLDCGYETSALGLKINYLRGERLINWSSVTGATGTSNGSLSVITLVTKAGKVGIAGAHGHGVLAASIWQHLRRMGKADGLTIPPTALSLWIPVPDSVPREMDWNNPAPPILTRKVYLASIAIVCVLVLCAWNWRLFDKVHQWGGQFLWSLTGFVYAAFRAKLLNARRVMVRSDRLEAEATISRIDLPWDRITVARWVHNSLTIGARGFAKVVAIPYDPKDPASATVILSIVRYLRARQHPMAVLVPETLWPGSTDESADRAAFAIPYTSPIVWRYTPLVFIVPMIFVIAMGLFIRVVGPFMPGAYYALILLLPVAYLFLYFATYSITAYEHGITIRAFWRARTCFWWQVASYEVKQVQGLSGYASSRILKDPAGKTILKFGPHADSDERAKAIASFMDSRLANVRRGFFDAM